VSLDADTVDRWRLWPGWRTGRPFDADLSARWLAFFRATGVYPRSADLRHTEPRGGPWRAFTVSSASLAIDATATVALPLTTGVERVVRALLSELAAHPDEQTAVVRWRDRGRVLAAVTPRPGPAAPGLLGRAAGNPAAVAALYRLGLGEPVKRGHARWLLRPGPGPGESRLLPEGTVLFLPETTALRTPEHFDRLHMLMRATPVRLLVLIHDLYPLTHPDRVPASTRSALAALLPLLPLAERVLASSPATARDIAAHAPAPCPVSVIPLAVDLPPAAAEVQPAVTRRTPPMVLSVGALEPRKNIAALIAAATLLWERGLDFQLTLVGAARGADRAAEAALSAALRAGRPLRVESNLPDAVLRDRYREARVYVQPSVFEGYGLPVLEAIAAGTPAIAAETGVAGQFAECGVTLCDTRDVPGLAAALAALLTDEARWQEQHRATARAQLRTWPQFASDLLATARALR